MKLILAFTLFFFATSQISEAQTDGKTKATSPTQTQQKGEVKQASPEPVRVNKANPGAEQKAAPAPTKTQVSPANSTQSGTPVKKDGTPDKRYKENKKLKKDGTPDMRYKDNKEKGSKTSGK
jgi:flagellar motor protein MotB